MCAVQFAEDSNHDRKFALKILLPEFAEDIFQRI